MSPKLFMKCCEWICSHPVEAADYESMFRWAAFILSGKSSSLFWQEFLYGAPNLLTLHNDFILLRKCGALNTEVLIKIWISAIEMCEQMMEMACRRKNSMKWSIIIFIQILKCMGRLYLLIRYTGKIIGAPPYSLMDRMDRKSFLEKNKHKLQPESNAPTPVPSIDDILKRNRAKKSHYQMGIRKLLAEIIFTIKPLAHLLMLYFCGWRSWKPFFVSATFDFVSLILIIYEKFKKRLEPWEEAISTQRCCKLILYLLRSPFYDIYFKRFITGFINEFNMQIPFARFLTNPMLEFIIRIERSYFYKWST